MISNTQAMATTIQLLGGRIPSQESLERTDHVPGARQLMDGIAQQLSLCGGTADDVGTSLNRIALHDEEVISLDDIDITYRGVREITWTEGCITPFYARDFGDYLERETRILQERTAFLIARAEQMKQASGYMTQTVQTLHDTLSQVQSRNEDMHTQSDDLDSQMHDSITVVTHSRDALLSSLDNGLEAQHADSYNTIYGSYTDFRGTFTNELGELDYSFEAAREEAEAQAEEVYELLQRCSSDADAETRYKEAIIRYLTNVGDDMQDAFERGEPAWENINEANTWLQNRNVETVDLDMMDPYTDIQQAWNIDEHSYVQARQEYISQAISKMQDIMLPLDDMLSALSLEDRQANEATVLCDILREEIANGRAALEPQAQNGVVPPGVDEALKQLFMDNAHLRGVDQVPLVILTQDDLIGELQALEYRKLEKERLEQEMIGFKDGKLNQILGDLNAAHIPYLNAIYANSPLNTSRPFSQSNSFNNLMNNAKAAAEKLNNETERLTKEVEERLEGKKTQKKLGAFVDRWSNVPVTV